MSWINIVIFLFFCSAIAYKTWSTCKKLWYQAQIYKTLQGEQENGQFDDLKDALEKMTEDSDDKRSNGMYR